MGELIYGQISPYTEALERSLESGDTRVTEQDDIRVTELQINNEITSSFVANPNLELFLSEGFVKVNGTWKTISQVLVHYNGEWVVPYLGYKNINGFWKRIL
jgi:hypothetical protein